MSGVHVIAIICAVAAISAIVELCRRRQIREKYALVWLLVGLIMAVVAADPSWFNHVAKSLGVVNPADLLAVVAVVFLLVVCVQYSWELGRMEDKTRILAEEVALLRHEIQGRPELQGRRELPDCRPPPEPGDTTIS